MKVDLDYIKEHADDTITPIIITNAGSANIEVLHAGKVEQGEKLLLVNN